MGGAAEPTTNATVGGTPIDQLTSTTGVTGDASGRMFLMDGLPVQASGNLSAIKLYADTATTSCKVSVWRSGEKIWQSATITLTANSVNTISISETVSVQPGDLLGVWLPASQGLKCLAFTGVTLRFATDATGALSSVASLTSTLSNIAGMIEVIAIKPMLAIVGDSIAAGTNTSSAWVAPYAGGTQGGNILAQPGYVAAKNKDWGYRNYALGSQTFAWVASTGVPAAVEAGATHIWIHCGVNDINTSRTWAAVLADLATIKAAIPSGVKLYISEILPWTNGTDPQAATLRTWNANLASWCSSNGAKLISCHDIMGQVRGSTGQLDDLKTAYNQDGVHITQAGVYKLAYQFAPVAPVFSSNPSIAGVAGVDVTVSVTPGVASNEPTYTYQWFADGVAIGGATSTSYTITSSELGKLLTVTQTATNSAGSTTATSASIGPVASYPFTVDFDGTNDDATGPVLGSNPFTGAFAINLGIDADAFSGYFMSVNNTQLLLAFIGTGGDIAFGNTSGWAEWTKSDGEWRFVHDTSLSGFARLRAFKDGVEQTKARTTASYVQFNPGTSVIKLGTGNGTFFNGRLSLVKVWTRACLPSDSDQTSNLVLRLGPISGTTWYDTSGNAINFTLNNGAVGV